MYLLYTVFFHRYLNCTDGNTWMEILRHYTLLEQICNSWKGEFNNNSNRKVCFNWLLCPIAKPLMSTGAKPHTNKEQNWILVPLQEWILVLWKAVFSTVISVSKQISSGTTANLYYLSFKYTLVVACLYTQGQSYISDFFSSFIIRLNNFVVNTSL